MNRDERDMVDGVGGNGNPLKDVDHLSRFTFEGFSYDERTSLLRTEQGDIEIQGQVAALISVLSRAEGAIVSADTLKTALWGDTPPENVSIRLTQIAKEVRDLIGDTPPYHVLKRVQGKGFRLPAPIHREIVSTQRLDEDARQRGRSLPRWSQFVFEHKLLKSPHIEAWTARNNGDFALAIYALDDTGAAVLRTLHARQLKIDAQLGDDHGYALTLVDHTATTPRHLFVAATGPGVLASPHAQLWLKQCDSIARLRLAASLARAVAAHHEHGLVHGQLSAESVVLVETESGQVICTICDMYGTVFTPTSAQSSSLDSPILSQSVDKDATQQSDLYALGHLCFAILRAELDQPLGTNWHEQVEDPLIRHQLVLATDHVPEERKTTATALATTFDHMADSLEKNTGLERRFARTQLWMRRWQSALIATLLVAMVLSLAVFTTNAALVREEAARNLAVQEAARSEAVRLFLQDVLVEADPNQAVTGPNATLGEALRGAAEKARNRFGDDPPTHAFVLETLRTIYGPLLLTDDHLSVLRDLEQILEATVPQDENSIALVRYRQLNTLARGGRIDEANALRDVLADQYPDPAALGGTVQLSALLANAQLSQLAFSSEDGVAQIDAALVAYRDSGSPDPILEADILTRKAGILSQLGKNDEAVAILEEILSGFDSTYASIGPQLRLRTESLYLRALNLNGQQSKANDIADDVLTRHSQFYGPDSFQYGQTLGDYAQMKAYLNDSELALESYRGASDIVCQRVGETHPSCLVLNLNIGILLTGMGDPQQGGVIIDDMKTSLSAMMGANVGLMSFLDYHRAVARVGVGETRELDQLIAGIDRATIGDYLQTDALQDLLAALEASANILQDRNLAESVSALDAALARLAETTVPDTDTNVFRGVLLSALSSEDLSE